MGKLFDGRGRRLTPAHTRKQGRRYRYYVTHEDDRDEDTFHGRSGGGWRLPARDLEGRVTDIVGLMLKDTAAIAEAALTAGLNGDELNLLLCRVDGAGKIDFLEWAQRIELHPHRIEILVKLPGKTSIELKQTTPMALRRRGCERRLVIAPEAQLPGKPDSRILRAMSLGLRFWERLNSDPTLTALEFARQEGVDNRYLGRTLPLAFLAPKIAERFAAGHQPPDWTAERLIRWEPLPLSWRVQNDSLTVAALMRHAPR
jgi:hypothetical protein